MTLERTEFRRDPDAIAAWNRKTQDNTNKRARARQPIPGQRNSSLRLVSERKLTAIDGGRAPRPASRGRRPRGNSFAATRSQQEKVRFMACVVCQQEPVDPAHLIDKSLCPEGRDDPRAVVPLCRRHHNEYDDRALSLLEHLEPHWHVELAFAVERFGLISTLNRVTNASWAPLPGGRSAA